MQMQVRIQQLRGEARDPALLKSFQAMLLFWVLEPHLEWHRVRPALCSMRSVDCLLMVCSEPDADTAREHLEIYTASQHRCTVGRVNLHFAFLNFIFLVICLYGGV